MKLLGKESVIRSQTVSGWAKTLISSHTQSQGEMSLKPNYLAVVLIPWAFFSGEKIRPPGNSEFLVHFSNRVFVLRH